jgi:hypothetical protein
MRLQLLAYVGAAALVTVPLLGVAAESGDVTRVSETAAGKTVRCVDDDWQAFVLDGGSDAAGGRGSCCDRPDAVLWHGNSAHAVSWKTSQTVVYLGAYPGDAVSELFERSTQRSARWTESHW